jgi:hypothetical protein
MEGVYEYTRAQTTDNFIKLEKRPTKEIEPPQRILIVSPTSNGVDHLLDLLEPLSK